MGSKRCNNFQRFVAASWQFCLIAVCVIVVNLLGSTAVKAQSYPMETVPPGLATEHERLQPPHLADYPIDQVKGGMALPWQIFAQGEYIGPARDPHLPEYRLRVDDQVTFLYRLTREVAVEPYELNVGDRVKVESLQDPKLDRELVIQPDGTITLLLLGQVRAAGRTVSNLRDQIQSLYTEYYKDAAITVTPLEVNAKLQDLRNTVDNRAGAGGQSITVTVAPDGTAQLPAVGSVPAHGLTLDEVKYEVDERYRAIVQGIEVTPVLAQRAPRFVYVLGEVPQPGRYELRSPTSAMQAIALAGGWRNGGALKQIVVFRRDQHWGLMATRLNLKRSLYGKEIVPDQDIWLRDSDIVLVPETPLKHINDFLELTLTRGVNEIIPILIGVDVLTPSFF